VTRFYLKSDVLILVDINNTMATKVVYFTVGGRNEQAEFRADDSTDDIRGRCVLCIVMYCFTVHVVHSGFVVFKGVLHRLFCFSVFRYTGTTGLDVFTDCIFFLLRDR
jgi:hypothetical protein